MDKLTGAGAGNCTKYGFVRELVTLNSVNKDGLKKLYDALYDRLTSYEDTGLSPEEIVELNTFTGSQIEKLLAENAILRAQLHEAQAERDQMKEVMQEFVDRCERGEVRSRYTYAKFKKILEEAMK